MRTKLALKVVGLIGVLALISAGYCFWLMTVPLSYDWVYAVVIGFVVAMGRVCHLVDQFNYFSSYDCVDHVVHRMLCRSGRPSNQSTQSPLIYAEGTPQSE